MLDPKLSELRDCIKELKVRMVKIYSEKLMTSKLSMSFVDCLRHFQALDDIEQRDSVSDEDIANVLYDHIPYVLQSDYMILHDRLLTYLEMADDGDSLQDLADATFDAFEEYLKGIK